MPPAVEPADRCDAVQHLRLSCNDLPDLGARALAQLDLPILVIYGEDDNAWSPAAQEKMAQRLGARRLCIPAAVHSPAVEAPATTASALTQFWDAAEAPPLPRPAAVTQTA